MRGLDEWTGSSYVDLAGGVLAEHLPRVIRRIVKMCRLCSVAEFANISAHSGWLSLPGLDATKVAMMKSLSPCRT
jgi:hypothetical protein